MMSNKPFVTFILIAYQAEKFIEEALDGALSQTYDNIEFIISDDCSKDKTFEIIEQYVKNYQGKHKDKIRLNRNEKNLGIAAHFNKLWFTMANGDWIVVAAGDDVSLPNRVEKVMEFAADDVAAMHHFSYMIDENSVDISEEKDVYYQLQNVLDNGSLEQIIKTEIHLRGATVCINKKVLTLFGPLNKDVINEDVILAYRARFYGKVIHINERLMRYREHSKSISFNRIKINYATHLTTIAKKSKWTLSIMRQVLTDNKILNLSQTFLAEVNNIILENKINFYLYGTGKFEPQFLITSIFYKNAAKRIILKPYYLFYKK